MHGVQPRRVHNHKLDSVEHFSKKQWHLPAAATHLCGSSGSRSAPVPITTIDRPSSAIIACK